MLIFFQLQQIIVQISTSIQPKYKYITVADKSKLLHYHKDKQNSNYKRDNEHKVGENFTYELIV